MTFFEEFSQRLDLPSPDFFKKIGSFGKWMLGTGLVILSPTLPVELGIQLPFVIPPVVTKIAGIMVFVGYVIKKMSDLTVDDKSLLQEPPGEKN